MRSRFVAMVGTTLFTVALANGFMFVETATSWSRLVRGETVVAYDEGSEEVGGDSLLWSGIAEPMELGLVTSSSVSDPLSKASVQRRIHYAKSECPKGCVLVGTKNPTCICVGEGGDGGALGVIIQKPAAGEQQGAESSPLPSSRDKK